MSNKAFGTVFRGQSPETGLGVSISGLGDVSADGRLTFLISDAQGQVFTSWVSDWVSTPQTVGLSTSSLLPPFVTQHYPGTVGGGDVNGDGIADILLPTVLGNGFLSLGVGRVVTGNSPLAAGGWIGDPRLPLFEGGLTKTTLSDLNGDGLKDAIIAAPGMTSPTMALQVDVYLGGPSKLAEGAMFPDFSVSTPYDSIFELRPAVSGGGDFNGDGVDDLLVSSDSAFSVGSAYILFGTTNSATLANLSLGELLPNQGMKISSSDMQTRFGESATFIGDFNHDGFDDVLIGGGSDGKSGNTAHLLLGRPGGGADVISEEVDFEADGAPDRFAFLAEISAPVFESSRQPLGDASSGSSELATPVSAAGDINNDGFDDFLVGAPGVAMDGRVRAGEAYLIFGRSGEGSLPSLRSTDLDGIRGYRFEGINAGDLAGYSVTGVGDIDNDGVDDFMIGAPGADDPETGVDAGASYLIYGGASRLRLLDEIGGAADGVIALADLGSSIQSPLAAAVDALSIDLSSGYGWKGDILADLLANDSNPGDSPLRIVGVDASTLDHARLYLEQSRLVFDASDYQSLVFSALKQGETRTERFSYTVEDEFGARDTASVSITLVGVNDAPIALPDALQRLGNAASFTIDVLANDRDPDGDPMTITSVSGAANGTVELNGDGTITYTPGANRHAPDALTYTVADPFGGTAVGKVDLPVVAAYSGLTLLGESQLALAGRAVTRAGDFNNDGVDDLLVGSPGYFTGTATEAGAAYVAFGSASGLPATLQLSALDGESGVKIIGASERQGVGYSLSGVGDVNGDGVDDLLIGSGNVFSSGDGDAYVVFGTPEVLPRSIDLDALDGSNGFRIQRDGTRAAHDRISRVSSLGDFNSDGIDDLVVQFESFAYTDQGYGVMQGNAQAGSVFVISGSDQGFGPLLRLDQLQAGQGFEVLPPSTDFARGQAVAGGGDFNGDGAADLVVAGGLSRANPATYLIFGSAAPDGVTLDLAQLQANQGFAITPPANLTGTGGFGSALSLGADFNADGCDDLVIGAPYSDGYSGSAFVVFGTGADLGSSYTLDTLNGSNGFAIEGVSPHGELGLSVASAGDINADGFDDLVVASPLTGGDNTGAAYVVYGTNAPFSALFDLDTLDGSNGFVLRGESRNDHFGFSVSAAGDLNGDGIDDLAVGAPYAAAIAESFRQEGKVYVVFGGREGLQAIDGFDGQHDGVIRLETLGIPGGAGEEPLPHVFSVTSPVAITEGDSAFTSLSFVVTRAGSLSGSVELDYAIAGGGATSDDVDRPLPHAGSLLFGDGEERRTVTVGVKGDLLVEPDESLTFSLLSGSAADEADVQFLSSRAVARIINDDEAAVFAVKGTSVSEANSGTAPLTFTITRAGDADDGVTVAYRLSGTGPRPLTSDDLTRPLPDGGELRFEPGETVKTVSVLVRGDKEVEYDETLQFEISSAKPDAGGSATVKTAIAKGSVLNDDVQPTITVAAGQTSVTEGWTRIPWGGRDGLPTAYNNFDGSVEFVVKRTGDLEHSASVDYFVSASTLAPRIVPAWESRQGIDRLFHAEKIGLREVTEATTFKTEAEGGDTLYDTQQVEVRFAFENTSFEEIVSGRQLDDITLQLFTAGFGEQGHVDSVLDFDYAYGGSIGLALKVEQPTLGELALDYGVRGSLRTPSFVPSQQAFAISTGSDFFTSGATIEGKSLNYGSLELLLEYEADPGVGQPYGFTNIEPISLVGVDLIEFQDHLFDAVPKGSLTLLSVNAVAGREQKLGGLLPDLKERFGGIADDIKFSFSTPKGNEDTAVLGPGALGTLQDATLSLSEDLAKVTFNALKILSKVPVPQLKWLDLLQKKYAVGGVDIEYSLIKFLLSAGYGLVEDLTFRPTGVSTVVTFNGETKQGSLGDAFDFIAPSSSDTLIEGSVEYSLQGELDISFKLAPVGTIKVESGAFAIIPDKTLSFEPIKTPPLLEKTFSGSTDFGSFEVYSQRNIEIDDLFKPVTRKFLVGIADVPQDTKLFGRVEFAPGESTKIVRLPLLAGFEPEPDVDVTMTLRNAVTGDGSRVKLLADQAHVLVKDDDIFVEVRARNWGDPHLATVDGLAYAFQAVGEFILVEAVGADADPLNIQVRTARVGSSDLVSANTAFATTIGSVRVNIDLSAPGYLRIDGVATALATGDAPLTVGNGQIVFDGSEFTLLYGTGEMASVVVNEGYLDIGLSLNEARAGKVRGLLGNADGDPDNDLQLLDGTVLTQPADFSELYGAFANGWRVTASNSLFDYAAGQSTDDFQDASFPRAQISLSDLPPDVLALATATVDGVGVADPIARSAAILDVALTGNPAYAQSALGRVEPISKTLELQNVPAVPASIGVSALAGGIPEGDDAYIEAQFIVYRIGDLAGQIEVAYSVGGNLDSDDFEPGQADAGVLTLSDGEASGVVSVLVRGDSDAELDEQLVLHISGFAGGGTPLLVAAPQARTSIVNDDGPLAVEFRLTALNGSQPEGSGEGTDFRFRVERSGDTRSENLVDVQVLAETSGGPVALDPSDYRGGVLPSAALKFAHGETSKTFVVSVLGDKEIEADEVIPVSMTATTPAGTLTLAAEAVVRNDDFAPVATDDHVAGFADAIITGKLLANDSDDGALTVQVINGGVFAVGSQIALPSGALLDIAVDGSFSYDAAGTFDSLAAGIVGVDSFTYGVSDGHHTDSATVYIALTGVNEAPAVMGDDIVLTQNGLCSLNVLSNDIDGDGDTLAVTSVLSQSGLLGKAISRPSGAHFTLSAQGDFEYRTNGAFVALGLGESFKDTIFYNVSDGQKTVQALLNVTVEGENDAPNARDDLFSVNVGDELSSQLFADNGMGADSDVDGDPLMVVAVAGQQAAVGKQIALTSGALLTVEAAGRFSYDPNARFVGLAFGEELTDSFSYLVSDGHGGVSSAMATVTIGGAPDYDSIGLETEPLPPTDKIITGKTGKAGNTGTTGADVIQGGATNDIINGLGGNDTIDGGEGVDTLVLNVSTADVLAHFDSFIFSPGHLSQLGSSLGILKLTNIERVQLNDGLYAVDTTGPDTGSPSGGKVWQAQAIFQCAFGHLADTSLLSKWVTEADTSSTMGELGQKMLDFYAPAMSSGELVNHLYQRLAGSAPTVETTNSFVDQIGEGKNFGTNGDLVAYAASLDLNTVTLIGFSGSIQGLEPLLFAGT